MHQERNFLKKGKFYIIYEGGLNLVLEDTTQQSEV